MFLLLVIRRMTRKGNISRIFSRQECIRILGEDSRKQLSRGAAKKNQRFLHLMPQEILPKGGYSSKSANKGCITWHTDYDKQKHPKLSNRLIFAIWTYNLKVRQTKFTWKYLKEEIQRNCWLKEQIRGESSLLRSKQFLIDTVNHRNVTT